MTEEFFRGKQLLHACETGNLLLALSLLTPFPVKIDLNLRTPEGSTPLYLAVDLGSLQLVKLLLGDPRVDVNLTNHQGISPFWIACAHGSYELVKFFLKDGRVDVNQRSTDGHTGLWRACSNGALRVVKLLTMDDRVDVNMADRFSQTPLWVAAHKGDFETVKWLLASKKTVDCAIREDITNTTVLENSKKRNFSDIAFLVEEYSRDPKIVRRALRKELGLAAAESAKTFALMVLLSDGYLRFRSPKKEKDNAKEKEEGREAGDPTNFFPPHEAPPSLFATQDLEEHQEAPEASQKRAEEQKKQEEEKKEGERKDQERKRFLQIALGLPMDLQMTLSHRLQDSQLELVSTRDAERALKAVLRPFLA